jgi:hypothetical protein
MERRDEMTDTIHIPDGAFEYLDELRRSGVTNMYGAGPYLEAAFDLDKKTARTVLSEWMRTFGDRRARGETGD